MLSYTRLAHDANVAAIAVHPGDALAIDPAEFDVDDTVAEVGPTELPAGPDAGLFLHDVLEVADLAQARASADVDDWVSDPAVQSLLDDKARGRGIASLYVPHGAQILHRTLTAPLALVDGGELPALVDAAAIAREVEFGYPIPDPISGPIADAPRGLVKGFIDVMVAWDDDLWVLDYKSDALVGDDLNAAAQRRVRERYAVQARLYAIAADRMRGRRRLAGLLFAFVRHGITVPVRVGDDTLAGWIAWLAQISQAAEVMNPAERKA